jgi:D-aminopeptidase
MLDPDGMTALFQAAAETTDEASLNALSMAETATGIDRRTAHAMPLDKVVSIIKRNCR